MKVKQIMLKNFANVHEIEINLKDDVTYLIGENGSGKTTVGLNAVWFILEGLALKGKNVLHGERFRFIGTHGASAVGKLVLNDEAENIDITITRKLLKNKTELKITASDKRQLPTSFIDDIFSTFSINPVGFAKLTPKEQATSLGIDTAKYDALKKTAYDERKELGYDVKRLKGALEEIGEVEAVDAIDLKELLKKKDQIEKANDELIKKAQAEKDKKVQAAVLYNKEQDERQIAITKASQDVDRVQEDINIIHENIKRLELQLIDNEDSKEKLINYLVKLPKPDEQKSIDIPLVQPASLEDTSALNQQIESAETTNQKAALYKQSVDARKKYTAAYDKHAAKQDEMDKIELNRIAYIKQRNLPFSNITIDDAGGVLINDRPFNETYFSKGEIIRIGIKLAAVSNPKLKYIFMPDSQSIDEKNREKLFTELVEAGFQVVAEYVDTEKQKDHGSILLKESKVVESYDEDEDLSEL